MAQHPRYPTIQQSTPPCRTQLKRRRRSQKSLELFWGMFRWVLVTYIPQIVCRSVCPSVCLSVRLAVVQFEMSTKAYTLHMNTSHQTKEWTYERTNSDQVYAWLPKGSVWRMVYINSSKQPVRAQSVAEEAGDKYHLMFDVVATRGCADYAIWNCCWLLCALVHEFVMYVCTANTYICTCSHT